MLERDPLMCKVCQERKVKKKGGTCAKCRKELAENEKIDRLEEAIANVAARDKALGSILAQLKTLWSTGTFPDGTRCLSEPNKMNALKILLQYVGGEEKVMDLRVNLVLDAHLLCKECQKKFLPDDRVSEEDVEEMFGATATKEEK